VDLEHELAAPEVSPLVAGFGAALHAETPRRGW
jgi:hypothetical protein